MTPLVRWRLLATKEYFTDFSSTIKWKLPETQLHKCTQLCHRICNFRNVVSHNMSLFYSVSDALFDLFFVVSSINWTKRLYIDDTIRYEIMILQITICLIWFLMTIGVPRIRPTNMFPFFFLIVIRNSSQFDIHRLCSRSTPQHQWQTRRILQIKSSGIICEYLTTQRWIDKWKCYQARIISSGISTQQKICSRLFIRYEEFQ